MEMTLEFMWNEIKASVAGQMSCNQISKYGVTTINIKYGMRIKFMQHEVNYQVIIKTRSICMFRYMARTIYFRIQVKRGWLLEIDGERRTMFKMGLVHARDNGPGISGTEPESNARYRYLLYARRS